MNDSGKPRRRIPAPDGPRRSGGGKADPWLITIVAAVIVVAGGWFLGQGLAHILGGRDQGQRVASAPTTVAVTPVPSTAAASASPAPSPSASPVASEKPSPTPHPVVKPAAKPSPKPTAPPASPTPAAAATQTPTPAPSPTVALLPKPTATPAPRPTHAAATVTAAPKPPPAKSANLPIVENAGESTVRAYIDALRRGDPTAATSYLGNGAPDEDFIDESTRIETLTSSANSDGSYRVRVTMQTSKGQMNETFVVAGSGNSARILEKAASKP